MKKVVHVESNDTAPLVFTLVARRIGIRTLADALTGRHGEAAQLAAIEATRELMADYPQRANRQALGSFFLDVAYFPGLAVLLIYKCASV